MIDIPSVNVGFPKPLGEDDGRAVYSGITKQPVPPGTVLWLSLVNLAGDGQADLAVHGGPDKAVYAYPSEHLADWEHDLGEDLGPAPFGENLSTRGVTEGDLCIVIERDPVALSVLAAPLAMADRHLEHRDLMEAVAGHPRLAAEWREPLRERIRRHA